MSKTTGSGNSPNIIYFVLMVTATQSIVFAQSFHFIHDNSTKEMSNLYKAKSLRKDLNNHIDYVKNMVKLLDNWAFLEIVNITENEELENTLHYLEENIHDIRTNITSLSLKSPRNIQDINDIITQSERLQTKLKELIEQFDNKTYKGLYLLGQYLDKPVISEIYKNFSEEKNNIDKKIAEQKITILTENCMEYILNRNYMKAEFTLDQIKDDFRITYLVEKLCSKDERNFRKIISFSYYVRNVTKSYLIYKELYNQINYIEEITILCESITNEIINGIKTSSIIRSDAINVVTALRNQIKFFCANELVKLLTVYKYVSKLEFEKITFLENVLDLDSTLLADVFYEFILNDPVLFPNYRIELSVKILHRLYDLRSYDWSELLKLGYFLNNLKKNIIVSNRYTYLSDKISEVESRLTEPVKNLVSQVSSYAVCIKNYYGKYLQLSDISFDRSYIVTSVSNPDGLKHPKYQWRFIRQTNDNFIIENLKINHGYLDVFVGNDYKSGSLNAVFINMNNNTQIGTWTLEFYGQNLLIKNIGNNEYLYSDAEKDDFVFTRKFTGDNVNYFRWYVDTC